MTGSASDESIALGWAANNRARVLLPRRRCGSAFVNPGVYLLDPRGG